MLRVLEDVYKKRGLTISKERQYDEDTFIKILNGQLTNFKIYVENNKVNDNMYFIDYLYEHVCKKNDDSHNKANKLFSKFYNTIAADPESASMRIFCRILTYTEYGKYEIVKTYITVRSLLCKGFHLKLDNESILHRFKISKNIIKTVTDHFDLDYLGVVLMLKEKINENTAHGDDLVLAMIDHIYKEKNNTILDYMSRVSFDGPKNANSPENFEDQLKKYHEVKFNHTIIKEESTTNAQISSKIIYRILTDE